MPWRAWVNEARMALAEYVIGLAMDRIAPKHHPDYVRLHTAMLSYYDVVMPRLRKV